MKSAISAIIIIFLLPCSMDAQSCGTFGSKNLTDGKFSYSWDGNVKGMEIVTSVDAQGHETKITGAEASAAFSSTINSIISEWESASRGLITTVDPSVNYPHVIIQILSTSLNETSTEGNFTVAYGNYGRSGTEILVQINDKPVPHSWTLNPSVVSPSYANLRTALLHEFGHVMTSMEHGANDIVMGANGNPFHNQNITSLQPCDIFNLREKYDLPHDITLKNSYDGGNIGLKGARETAFSYPSVGTGGIKPEWRDSDFPASIQAIEVATPGIPYKWKFNAWINGGVPYASTITTTIPGGNGTYIADFSKEYELYFRNNRSPFGNGGQIKINEVLYSSPTPKFLVIEFDSIKADAVNETINGVEFLFEKWTDLNTQTVYSGPIQYFSPTNPSTYEASFTCKILPPQNVFAGGAIGDNVSITWTAHPLATQYQIWRAVKHGKTGILDSPTLLGTVNQGTTNFVDNDYIVTNTYTDCLLNYDVRAVYQSGSTTLYSDPSYIAATFGTMPLYKKGNNLVNNELINNISIGSYPNPFNPVTVFKYQLPNTSEVKLKVFDSVGREIAVLVDGIKETGVHNVAFKGNGLASGIYYAHFSVIPQDGSKNYSETIKILLAK